MSAPTRRSILTLLLIAGAIMLGASPYASAAPPKTRLECEHKYGIGTSWRRCFSEPPGSSCAHPLEVQKAGDTYRGDRSYFKVRFVVEPGGVDSRQTYSWAVQPGVAICPHGITYHVARLGEVACQRIEREKVCTDEFDRKTIPVETGSRRGSFTYDLPSQPLLSYYLVIRGYFVHTHR